MGGAPTPSEGCTGELEQAALDAVRRHFPERYEVYVRCGVNREPQKDVAVALGINLDTVGQRIKAARVLIAAFRCGLWPPEDGDVSLRALARSEGVRVDDLEAHFGCQVDMRAGRRLHRKPDVPRRCRSTVCQWGTWYRLMDQGRRQKGWTWKRLHEEAGVAMRPKRVYGGGKPRIVPVIRMADALEIPRETALHVTGHSTPSPLGWSLIELHLKGETLDGLAERFQVHRQTIGSIILNPDHTLRDRNLDKFAELLTPGQVEALRDRHRQNRIAASSKSARQRDNSNVRSSHKSEEFRKKTQKRSRALWQNERPKMEAALRKARYSERIEIPRRLLEPLIRQGKTYREIAVLLRRRGIQATHQTVARRAEDFGMQSDRAKRRSECARAARGRAGRTMKSQELGEAALKELRSLGSEVLGLDYRTFAKKHRVQASWARQALKDAKTKALVTA